MPRSPTPILAERENLAAVNRDVRCLSSLTANIRMFITKSNGEDRSKHENELLRWEVLLEEMKERREAIEEKIKGMTP